MSGKNNSKSTNTTVSSNAYDPLNFKWDLMDVVAGCAMPGRYGDIEGDFNKLKDEGIEVIINLTCTVLDIPPEFNKCFKVHHFPVVDGHAPEDEQVDEVIKLVKNTMSDGKKAVVHCRGGIGRTATVLIPLIMTFENLPLDEAILKVKLSGRYTQSREQREFLKGWAQNMMAS
jgi:protein tyrosine phosphatase